MNEKNLKGGREENQRNATMTTDPPLMRSTRMTQENKLRIKEMNHHQWGLAHVSSHERKATEGGKKPGIVQEKGVKGMRAMITFFAVRS